MAAVEDEASVPGIEYGEVRVARESGRPPAGTRLLPKRRPERR